MHARYNCLDTLMSAGFSYEDATALRRISMTLHRWHELECGDGNSYGSWAITRGAKHRKACTCENGSAGCPNHDAAVPKSARYEFVYDDDGKPYLEHHHYMHGKGKDTVTHSPMADRERGALKRLAAIMARYPGFASYVQGDPRGCALYILRPGDIREGETADSCYTRGIAVCK